MQSLERRLISLEAAKARQLERLTDAELDQRIAALLAQMPSKGEAASNEVTQQRNTERSIAKWEDIHAKS